MATTWPQATAWPNELREHATYLSNYLREALLCIEAAKEQPVPTPLVKTIITSTFGLIKKLENTPDFTSVMEALTAIQGDVKTVANTA
jgi:hypothetical protein